MGGRPRPTDDVILRHAAAMGRAARKTGEPVSALRALWRIWCADHGVDPEAGWAAAVEAFEGEAAN